LPAVSQTNDCPDVPGGWIELNFSDEYGNTFNFYPDELPAGGDGTPNATVGTLFANGPKAAAYAPATVIVHPVLGDGKTGSVVIQFLWLEIMGTSGLS